MSRARANARHRIMARAASTDAARATRRSVRCTGCATRRRARVRALMGGWGPRATPPTARTDAHSTATAWACDACASLASPGSRVTSAPAPPPPPLRPPRRRRRRRRRAAATAVRSHGRGARTPIRPAPPSTSPACPAAACTTAPGTARALTAPPWAPSARVSVAGTASTVPRPPASCMEDVTVVATASRARASASGAGAARSVIRSRIVPAANVRAAASTIPTLRPRRRRRRHRPSHRPRRPRRLHHHPRPHAHPMRTRTGPAGGGIR